MSLEKALTALSEEFKKKGIDFALIGGLALRFAGVQRSTEDVDFMVLLADSDKAHQIMGNLGYQALQRTENVANYSGLSGLGQVDFIYAHRRYALSMLQNAKTQNLFDVSIKVVAPEDLVGLKIQSSSSDPSRKDRDMLDVKQILQANAGSLDMSLVREYFQLFKREGELDEILKGIK